MVDSEILFFLCSLLCDLGLCFCFIPFDTDARWFALPHVLHFHPNAGQASRRKAWLLPHLRQSFDIVERIGVLMACILVLSTSLLFIISLSCLM